MKNFRKFLIYMLALSSLLCVSSGATDALIGDAYSFRKCDFPPDRAISCAFEADGTVSVLPGRASSMGIALKDVSVSVFDEIEVIPGGMPFGVKLYAAGLIVVGFSDVEKPSSSAHPAADAGMKIHDIITAVNGENATCAEDFVKLVENSNGSTLIIEYTRGTEKLTAEVTPSLSSADGKYKVGMWVRDSTAGIGTVTFIIPDTLAFGGLGHGICDSASGELIPLSRGTISDVVIDGIEKGISGTPGELRGAFSSGKRGSVVANTENGIFGVFSELDKDVLKRECVPIALQSEIREGDASIFCTLGDGGIGEYAVRISDIFEGSSGQKSFVVTITDDGLIDMTGGIVQGMSGSPIMQDGRLIGAVTHVLISDPKKGYGIFIENMLTQIPELIK